MSDYGQKTMMRTRAELLGVKPKVLAARVRRRLKSLRSQVEGISAAFEDIDMAAVAHLEEVPDW